MPPTSGTPPTKRWWVWGGVAALGVAFAGGPFIWRAYLDVPHGSNLAPKPAKIPESPLIVPGPSEGASAARTSTQAVVYVLNSSTHTLSLLGVDFNERGTKVIDVVHPREIGQIRYAGFDRATLMVEVYEGGKSVFRTPIEDFSGGSWVWAFDGKKALRTRDLSALPKLPPGER